MKCLDGSVYIDDEDDPRLDIGVGDACGYLLQVRDGQVTIRGALYDGGSGAPTVAVVDECGVFDERMGAYLGRFTRSA